MTYLTLHRYKERFEFFVLALLGVAFLVAVAAMFFHPTLAIALVFIGLIVLGANAVVMAFIGRAERAAAKASLDRHTCPHCGAPVTDDQTHTRWQCEECESVFLATGLEQT